ncbi:hypothetical protein ACFPC0_01785 [Streptomyces andamanensis]|uniref:Uncharacterized protein n=1 Tax=Streptomyces andamanensis TaxID=1565035 RepID=A0ABV8T723_9ACTN
MEQDVEEDVGQDLEEDVEWSGRVGARDLPGRSPAPVRLLSGRFRARAPRLARGARRCP